MNKIMEIIIFELKYQLRRPSIWIHFFATVGLLMLIIDEIIDYAQKVEDIQLNSALTIADISGYACKFGMLLMAALVSDIALRDIAKRMDALVFTTSINKWHYLFGRFLAAFLLAAGGIMAIVIIAVTLFNIFSDNAESFGTPSAMAFINAGMFLILPNAFITTAIIFSSVLITRRSMAAYAGAILIFIFNILGSQISPGMLQWGQIIDPFATAVLNYLAATLNTAERNTADLTLHGYLLLNRLLWTLFSLILIIVAFSRFKLLAQTRKKIKKANVAGTELKSVKPVMISKVKAKFDKRSKMRQLICLSWDEFKAMATSRTGLFIPLFSVFVFLFIPKMAEGPMQVPAMLTSFRVISLMSHPALKMLMVFFIAIIAGNLVWKERDVRLNEIYDVVPVSNTSIVLGKYFALTLMLFMVQLAAAIAGIAVELTYGGHPDYMLYIEMAVIIQWINYSFFAAVFLAIHILINQKHTGHLIILLFFLYTAFSSRIGIEHKLLVFGSDMGMSPSDFYSQSPFIFTWLIFKLYWLGWLLLLMTAAVQMWPRGRKLGSKFKFHDAIIGAKKFSVYIASFLVLSTGMLIFYNTNILNDYHTGNSLLQNQADYEHKYGKYKNKPQPVIIAETLHIELYPSKKKAHINGIYALQNNTLQPISEIYIDIPASVNIGPVKFSKKGRTVIRDSKLGCIIYLLDRPLLPHDKISISYMIGHQAERFSDDELNTAVMDNGTCLKSWQWLPALGYQRNKEITGEKLRDEYNLPFHKQVRALSDVNAWWDTSGGRELINIESTIGTEVGQTVVAPGSLKNTWLQNGRKYFKYISDSPIRNMFHIYCAKYQVQQTQFRNTALQVFYQRGHELNLSIIEKSMKASLRYYEENFTPYQFRQLRFVEYPDSGTGGISLSGTIGFSPNFAMLNSNNSEFNLPFAVAAHEIAHQWWGHQLSPADVEGIPLLSESLAWYSALGVVEQEYGSDHLRKLLQAMRKSYLTPRSRADVALLYSVNKFQAYRKGPFVMYALKEYIGEKQLNKAFKNLLHKFESGTPPFATSTNLYGELQKVTPVQFQYLLKDLFEENTFWDLKTKQAVARKEKNGSWLVTIEVFAKKVKVSAAGVITDIPMEDQIEIGVLGDGGIEDPLYLQKKKIYSGTNRFTIKLLSKPKEAGIDPRNLLLDTEINDNMKIMTE
jgi:ABC-2 type transport system permease protein